MAAAAAAVGGCGPERVLCFSAGPVRPAARRGQEGSAAAAGSGGGGAVGGGGGDGERRFAAARPRRWLRAPSRTCWELLGERVRETAGEVSQCLAALCKTCSESHPAPARQRR